MIKRVCVLTTGHGAFDVRIFHKECKSLAEADYEVYLVASHDKKETVENIRIIPLNGRESRAYRFFIKGWAALWKAMTLKADVYHFHDPDLILGGAILKLFGKKVIYDVHEDVPKDILSKEWLGSLTVRKILSVLASIFLKLSTLFFDRIIAATPSISEGFPDHKTITLRNVPKVIFIDGVKPEPIIKTKPSVIYAGGLTEIRGIKEIIEAVGKLDGLVELWLLGWWEDPHYERECKALKEWSNVRDFGLRPLEQTYSIMKSADIGIVNFLAVPNSVESLPNKAFEYLVCGLPLIMSDFQYWKDLFGTCAVFVNPIEPKNIAEKIKSLVTDHAYRNLLIEEGRRLIEKEYSWEVESKKMIELYKNLA